MAKSSFRVLPVLKLPKTEGIPNVFPKLYEIFKILINN